MTGSKETVVISDSSGGLALTNCSLLASNMNEADATAAGGPLGAAFGLAGTDVTVPLTWRLALLGRFEGPAKPAPLRSRTSRVSRRGPAGGPALSLFSDGGSGLAADQRNCWKCEQVGITEKAAVYYYRCPPAFTFGLWTCKIQLKLFT